MPVKSEVDTENRIIYTLCQGEMAVADIQQYLNELWSDSTYYGFNELFDAREGGWDNFDFGSLIAVAKEAASLNAFDPESKLAWLVVDEKTKMLTDFYKAAKASLPANSRNFKSFYSADEAMDWLKS